MSSRKEIRQRVNRYVKEGKMTREYADMAIKNKWGVYMEDDSSKKLEKRQRKEKRNIVRREKENDEAEKIIKNNIKTEKDNKKFMEKMTTCSDGSEILTSYEFGIKQDSFDATTLYNYCQIGMIKEAVKYVNS